MIRIGLHNKYYPFQHIDLNDRQLPNTKIDAIDAQNNIVHNRDGNFLHATRDFMRNRISLTWNNIDLNLCYQFYNLYINSRGIDKHISFIADDSKILDANTDNIELSETDAVYLTKNKQSSFPDDMIAGNVTAIQSFSDSSAVSTTSTNLHWATHTFRFPLSSLNGYPFTSVASNQFDIDAIDNLVISYIGYGYGPYHITGLPTFGCTLLIWNAIYSRWDLINTNDADPVTVTSRGLIIKVLKRHQLKQYIINNNNTHYITIQARSAFYSDGAEDASLYTNYIRIVMNEYLCKMDGDLSIDDVEFAASIPILGKKLTLDLLEVSDVG